ncbi:hypothetical protein BraRD5C2_39400 [Bradyrhizobium sp. RD5-C2]|nr:hypothetical protein BraRD5C2_39400 [Bradyrhizobium sp. RD5-C2]
MLGLSRIAEPLSAEKQRPSLLGLKKYEMKITCPVPQIIGTITSSGNNPCELHRRIVLVRSAKAAGPNQGASARGHCWGPKVARFRTGG